MLASALSGALEGVLAVLTAIGFVTVLGFIGNIGKHNG